VVSTTILFQCPLETATTFCTVEEEEEEEESLAFQTLSSIKYTLPAPQDFFCSTGERVL
jgi:hypothetical protein